MAETFGLAVNVATVVDLFVKVGVQCSEYCAGVKAAPRDVRYILNEANKFTATLRDIERLLAGPNGAKIEAAQNVRSSVQDCREQLHDLTAKLDLGTGWGKRIKWPLNKHEVDDLLHKLERCRAAISSDLQIHQTALLTNVHQDRALRNIRTAERATFDAYADTENARCYPGTRADILLEVQSWAATSNSECIFWLNGMAGTGKSTISRTVAQSFADKGILGASFFFKRGEGDRGRAVLLFPTIITQLIQKLPSLAPHVRDEIEAEPRVHEKSINEQFDKLIKKPIQKLLKLTSPLTIVIVVDALDECDNLADVRLIIYLLSQVKHFGSLLLKFFVTSRPELPIQLGFKDISSKYRDLILHEIPKPIIKHDIAIFLEYTLARIREDYNKCTTANRQLPRDWPGKEHTKQLVDMAIPLFIFAATICRFLQDRRLGGPRDQLASILKHQDSQKSNLDATYLPVLDRLLAGLHGSKKRDVAKRFKQVVGSIVILASPLSSSSLAELLGVSHYSIDDHLANFHSVLSIPPDSDAPVRLLHLSFREFVIDPGKGKEKEKYPFWVDKRETHERLAVRCLQLLSTGNTLKKDICDLHWPGACRSEINQQTIDASLPPEVQYACRYWVYHWKESKGMIRDSDHIHDFLRRYLLYWLEALSLLGWISESIGMIDDLSGLLDPANSSHVSAFLRDAKRIILSHRSVIDEWPLQIYHSAIIFTPEQSIVRKMFQHEFPNWLSLLPQVDQDWDTCLQTLEGHGDSVRSVAFSQDSTMLASASDDRTVRLWDTATGACTRTLEGHGDSVRSVAFSQDSTMLASASDDRTVRLWDTATGACTRTLKDLGIATIHLAFNANSSLLYTDVGAFALNSSSSLPSLLSSPLPIPVVGPVSKVNRRGIGLSEDGIWVTWDSYKMLWLPLVNRPECSVVTASIVGFGCLSGRVVLIATSLSNNP